MHYGLSLPNGGPCADPRTLADFAALAEAVGFEAVFLEDYLIYQNQLGMPTFDPWVSLAAIAMRTQTVRLGTLVTPLTRRHVAKLAAETVALDHLPGGRVTLGIGLGDPWDASLRAFGDAAPTAQRAQLLDESLDVLAGLWSGEPFSYNGQQLHIDEVTFAPKPIQRPRIPIWVGGRYPNPGPVRRAARWDGACLFKAAAYTEHAMEPAEWTPEDIRELTSQMPAENFDIVVGGRPRAADWDAERTLMAELAAAGATWWTEWMPPADRATMQAAIERGPLV
jgi:alkanesulfonate monooxygenase SsuD/methylene tetrahydromethanopterin reductase-like flavin-dependent oxidoreductase (luciferase family)